MTTGTFEAAVQAYFAAEGSKRTKLFRVCIHRADSALGTLRLLNEKEQPASDRRKRDTVITTALRLSKTREHYKAVFDQTKPSETDLRRLIIQQAREKGFEIP